MTWQVGPALITLSGRDFSGEYGKNKFFLKAGATAADIQAMIVAYRLNSNSAINSYSYEINNYNDAPLDPVNALYVSKEDKAELSILWSDGVKRKWELMCPGSVMFSDGDEVDITNVNLLAWFTAFQAVAIQRDGATPAKLVSGKRIRVKG